MIKEIEKAINMSDIGINPTNDGQVVRLVFPELTEDRRKELVKDVKKKGEQAKVAVRNIRRDGNDAFKKLKGSDVSEDEIKAFINEKFADVIATKNKGAIMKSVMPALKGKADGKMINSIVAELCK